MKQAVEVPQVGESVTSGILAVWNVSNGDYVHEGDEIFELETDKATLPVPAPVSGTISISVQADEEVEVGTAVAEIDTEGAPSDAAAAPDSASPERSPDSADEGQQPLSPAVRRVLEENGLSAATVAAAVTPSGKDGRLTKGDVDAYLKGRGESAAAGGTSAAAPAPESAPAKAPATAAPAASGSTAPGGQERKKMTKLRQTIAANLVSSKQQSAHLTTFNEVDMSAAMALRTKYKGSFEEKHGVRLGFMSFFVTAAQRALVDFPSVNAFVDGTEIIYNYFYNVGVAISTDAGLLVPVLRNVDALSFADIESQIVDFATRAKSRRLLPDEFSGGTFTITNGGVFGSLLSTPIPSPPQTAVLGMHSINKRAVVVDDEIVIRPMMYLALTYDHRIIDGREAIGFLNRIKGQIEDPPQLLFDL
ncbi:MAG TPA: 2-oxoglutarate dehydrogenase complex dihydrolipoyllysine-residue succinyltransferase [Alkalispirochaeta sp.]|nr:2-oxoglutarate dehydrogenase complex dihydrolipoyllysine-residue succinyltransferase [Alkalispirochaeta sp.]